MILNVPFIKQANPTDCGPTCLKMVLDFFDKENNIPREELSKMIEVQSTGATISVGIAKAAAELGYDVEFYTIEDESNDENFDLDFYKEYSDGLDKFNYLSKKLKKEFIECGGRFYNKELSLNEVLNKMSDNYIPIVLFNWYDIKGKDGFLGHFVPVIGYDEDNIIFHQAGLVDTEEAMKVDRKTFDKARKYNGTDQDIIFIKR